MIKEIKLDVEKLEVLCMSCRKVINCRKFAKKGFKEKIIGCGDYDEL